MKFAIVSDTHDNMANFKKAMDWMENEKIQLILHCGDICSQEAIDQAKKYFGGTIIFVKGNGDYDIADLPEKMELEIPIGSPSASSGRPSLKVAFCHFPDLAKKMAQSDDHDLVFYGHTHRPWDEKIGKCHMINPGELAGQFYKATFAVYDTKIDKLELKILEKI